MFNTHACKQSFAQLINCVLIQIGPTRGPRHILTFRFELDHELGMISGQFHRSQSTGTLGTHVSIVVMAFCSEAQDVGRRWRCCERDTYRMVGVTFVDAVYHLFKQSTPIYLLLHKLAKNVFESSHGTKQK